jgi:tetratricopeptide (TPR) repeat protein
MKVFFYLSFLIFVKISIYSQPDLTSSRTLELLLEADGITKVDDINSYKKVYDKILTECKSEVSKEQSVFSKHEVIFNRLHDDYLKKYQNEAYINKLFKGKEFNCVTAVVLYNMICTDLGLEINLYESPFHVFITAPTPGNRDFKIELTDPVDGFNASLDNSEYVEYLLDYKLITEEELKEKGEVKILNEFISETHQISSRDLVAIYYANIGFYNLLKDSTAKAYNYYKKSISFAYDSTRAQSLIWVWASHVENIQNDIKKLNSFLLENLDSIPVDKSYYDQIINSSAIAIDFNVDKNDFESAENIFNKLESVLPDEMLKEDYFIRIELAIKSNKIQNKIIRGDYEAAYSIATDLYVKNKDNSKVLDIYLQCGNIYMQNLGLNRETDRLVEVADSMFTNAPGIKSVEDNFVLACINAVVKAGLYKTNHYKSKEILFAANKKLPNNKGIKETIAYLYHEIAMAEIRNRNYKKALEILNDGLKYDPENWELKHEIELTKGLLNKR